MSDLHYRMVMLCLVMTIVYFVNVVADICLRIVLLKVRLIR